MLGRPHAIAARADTCAIGAAMLAAVASGVAPDLASLVAALPPPAVTIEPDPRTRAVHDEAYARHIALFEALRPLF